MARRRKVPKATREQVLAWLARWEHVADFERREQAESTPDDRLRELGALIQMAQRHGLAPTYTDEEIAHVRETWAKIRTGAVKGHAGRYLYD